MSASSSSVRWKLYVSGRARVRVKVLKTPVDLVELGLVRGDFLCLCMYYTTCRE